MDKRVLRTSSAGSLSMALPNENLPSFYQSSNIVIFPSVIAEGFGLVLVEALGCECALVVSDFPAKSDIISEGETALVVPQKDVKLLAQRVNELLDNSALRTSLGKAGRQFVLKHFDLDRIAEKYIDLIESTMSSFEVLK